MKIQSNKMARPIIFLVVATGLWLPSLHWVFQRPLAAYRVEAGLSPVAGGLAATYLHVWADPVKREQELAVMRKMNPEWDFMSRTYMVLALANIALREETLREKSLEIIDAILLDTLDREQQGGAEHFLMGYGQHGNWVMQPPRSIFVDGEMALMIAARRMVEERVEYRPLLEARVTEMLARMQQSPVLCAESYPDECWIFCNSVALAALRLADVLDGTDHQKFFDAWFAKAQENLVDPESGLLISAFGVDGSPAPAGPGPEGSSIWMAAHMLAVVNPGFATDQYHRAKSVLGGRFLGFGYSREWPRGMDGQMDIDSGPVVPLLGASASASGLAILGAASFNDHEYFLELMTALRCAGFPVEENGRLRFLAGNQVGDAVLLYAMVEGPLWDLARRRAAP